MKKWASPVRVLLIPFITFMLHHLVVADGDWRPGDLHARQANPADVEARRLIQREGGVRSLPILKAAALKCPLHI